MKLLHTVAAGVILACSQLAGASTLELSHLTLSDIHFWPDNDELGPVAITETGNVSSLDLTGFADQIFVERTGDTGAELWKTLHATATAAAGYTVKSIRFRAVLDVTDIDPPEQNLNFAFYLQSPTMMGIGWGEAYDGRAEDWTFQLASDGIDGSKPFELALSTAAAVHAYSPALAGSYASVGFRSITLDIETVPVIAQVPEPGTWAMLLVGLAGVGAAVGRRRH